MHAPGILVRYEAAKNALADCLAVDEVKNIRDQAVAMQVYARHAKDSSLIEYATEIRLRAERRAGELLAGMDKAKGTRGQLIGRGVIGGSGTEPPIENDDTPTLAELGISKKQSSQWQKIAGLGAPEFETHVEEIKHRAVKSTQYSPSRDDDSDEWYSSAEIIEAVRDVLGTIDLDPASCDAAQRTVRASRYFTKQDDGSAQEWRGKCWLNPPFSSPLMGRFVKKLCSEVKKRHVSAAILLVNVLSSESLLQEAIEGCSAVCFSRGRLRFTHQTGKIQNNHYHFGIFYFGPDVEKFFRRFSEFGRCLK